MTLEEIAKGLKTSLEARDGKAMAALFTKRGVYHDVFYGAFEGPERIAELVNDWVYRFAKDLNWEFFSPLSDGKVAHLPYVFSYVSTIPEAKGKRVGFEGVSLLHLKDGLIQSYREIANTGPALLDIGFAPARVATILQRQNAQLQARPEYLNHHK